MHSRWRSLPCTTTCLPRTAMPEDPCSFTLLSASVDKAHLLLELPKLGLRTRLRDLLCGPGALVLVLALEEWKPGQTSFLCVLSGFQSRLKSQEQKNTFGFVGGDLCIQKDVGTEPCHVERAEMLT